MTCQSHNDLCGNKNMEQHLLCQRRQSTGRMCASRPSRIHTIQNYCSSFSLSLIWFCSPLIIMLCHDFFKNLIVEVIELAIKFLYFSRPNYIPIYRNKSWQIHSQCQENTCNTRMMATFTLSTQRMARICLCFSTKWTHFIMNAQLLSRS